MSVVVHFRGPILFVHDDTNVLDIRIPECRNIATHADKTPATTHHAGILRIQKDGTTDITLIENKDSIEIVSGAETELPTFNGTFSNKVAVDQLVFAKGPGKDLTLEDVASAKVLAVIKIKGGRFTASNFTTDPIEIPYKLNTAPRTAEIPLLTTWTAKAPTTIRGSHVDLTLADGDEAYVFNWDNASPKVFELTTNMDAANNDPFEPEADFKWIYQVLHARQGLEQWLTDLALAELPAPNSTVVRSGGHIADAAEATPPMYPPNSACDGGNWHEPPI